MESEGLLCVICNKQSKRKVLAFTEKILEKSHEVLKIRQKHKLKYKNVILPSCEDDMGGYHTYCYKNFIAVMKKYYDDTHSISTSDVPPTADVMEERNTGSEDVDASGKVTNVTIKHEVDNSIVIEEHNINIPVKTEKEFQEADENIEQRDISFGCIQLEIKQETDATDTDSDQGQESEENDEQIQVKNDPTENISEPHSNMYTEEAVKQEHVADDLVSYDYPDFDARSMDSNEATAFSSVEACLQDNVKAENNSDVDENQLKEEYNKISIQLKQESNVTETHLITNKLINTTSTVTNPHDGFYAQTTKTLVMEITPMCGTSVPLSKIGNPEEILPTTCHPVYSKCDLKYDGSEFQLNSITGNVLSLEQHAYDLLKTKKRDAADSLYCCTKCPKVYSYSKSLRRHLEVHKSIENHAMGVIKARKTRIANKKKKLRVLKKETKKEGNNDDKEISLTDEYECTCGKVFHRRSRMETCLRSHDHFSDSKSCFSCISCTKQFKNKDELTLHRKRLHSRKKFPCKFCPTDYNTRKELFKHLQIHQKVQLMEYKVISEVMKGKQKLTCFMCTKKFSQLSELKYHVMVDHKEPFTCLKCKETFVKIIDFANHTKISHPEVEGQSVLDVVEAFSKLVKAWKCEECELQFHEVDKLALHQIEKHSPDLKTELQFQCSDCRRVFISQKGLTSHRRIHHNVESTEDKDEVEKSIMCLECRKMCKDINALTSHMRLHSPDRKYPCKYCDFRFATPEKRKAHAEIHVGDMRYVCFICEYTCSSENRLKLHKMSLKHLNMKEYLLTGKPLIEEESQSTSKKEKLKEPSKEGTKKAKKRRKEESGTDGESVSSRTEESTCDICGENFSSENKMLEHKQSHPFIEFPNDDKPTRIFFK